MPLTALLLLLCGAILAATGQILFKIGASGREALSAFFNAWLAFGLIAYAIGTLLWIYVLSKLRLTVVYPFTALTFVLVYVFGALILREPVTAKALIGVGMVLGGLLLISIN